MTPPAPRSRRRWTTFQAAVGALFAASASGIVVATVASTSPEEAAASRAAPTLAPPTTRVVRQPLVDAVRVPCRPATEPIVVRAPQVPAGSRRVVTAVAAPETELRTGDVVLVVSGVPVMAVVTPVPLYRDLAVGDSGPDVELLEKALVERGRLTGADRTFDARTAEALDAVYAAAGVADPDLAHRLRVNSVISVPPRTRVGQALAGVGDVVAADTPLVELDGPSSRLTCQVPASARLSVGRSLTLSAEEGAGTADRTVVVSAVGEEDGATAEQPVTVQVKGAAGDVRPGTLVIEVSATDGPVLTVPAGALWTGPDGRFLVRKLGAAGVTTVAVQVGATAAGWVAVSGTGLAEGDTVEVHVVTEQGGAAPAPAEAPASGETRPPAETPAPSGAAGPTAAGGSPSPTP